MMLTTKGKYAVMAMLDIATNAKFGPVTIAEIANRQKIAHNYLEQIVTKLSKSGLLIARRGPGGGYIIGKEASEIKIGKIIDAVGEDIKITRCSGEGGCVKIGKKCSTHDLWMGLGDVIYGFLDKVTISDVLEGKINDISRS